MPSVTFTTDNTEILSDLDEITAEYEGTLGQRIKKYVINKLRSDVNKLRHAKAKREAVFTEANDADFS